MRRSFAMLGGQNEAELKEAGHVHVDGCRGLANARVLAGSTPKIELFRGGSHDSPIAAKAG